MHWTVALYTSTHELAGKQRPVFFNDLFRTSCARRIEMGIQVYVPSRVETCDEGVSTTKPHSCGFFPSLFDRLLETNRFCFYLFSMRSFFCVHDQEWVGTTISEPFFSRAASILCETLSRSAGLMIAFEWSPFRVTFRFTRQLSYQSSAGDR